jgi:hypothetical protein
MVYIEFLTSLPLENPESYLGALLSIFIILWYIVQYFIFAYRYVKICRNESLEKFGIGVFNSGRDRDVGVYKLCGFRDYSGSHE